MFWRKRRVEAKQPSTPIDKPSVPVVMSVAGMDPCGGAGVLADMRAVEALGCFGTAVVTAVTVQNTLRVSNVWPLMRKQVREQGEALLADIVPDAVKVGMLGGGPAAKGVKDVLLRYLTIKYPPLNPKNNYEILSRSAKVIAQAKKLGNIVADTILDSTSGEALYDMADMQPMMNILKLARVITPNLPEADNLAHVDKDNLRLWLTTLSLTTNGASVYLKGGHGGGDIITDVFFNAETEQILTFTHSRVATKNTHGTGCTLSSAMAACLARGMELNEAARCASAFTYDALKAGAAYSLGHGHGPTYFGNCLKGE